MDSSLFRLTKGTKAGNLRALDFFVTGQVPWLILHKQENVHVRLKSAGHTILVCVLCSGPTSKRLYTLSKLVTRRKQKLLTRQRYL